ncbi:hypothetical protein [Flavobacterium sp. SORGH_AS_0622]|jgi:hypothetical protein|uniref:hypothetical protein n=1 Tax=Flavobacterium sp. SORGH_AS_0622 TaxID=3041772 RepID=UPI002785FBF1|nr:hypothetical protein [Flavobacterium sp. SORGH_AS_0622]MDQ1164914.1 hypothetical protein [Flavobacterium sp. SORGH_AS_0622]
MKKILTLFAVVGLMAFSSCSNNDDDVDNDTISEVYEVSNVNFTSANNYNPIIGLNPAIFDSDMVLVYRLVGVDNGNDVWRLAPENYFLADGTLDFGFDYDFTKNDVSIYMVGNNLGGVVDSFRLNQIFRIVIIPGYVTTGKSVNKPDYSNYNEVIKRFNIDDSNIKKIKL